MKLLLKSSRALALSALLFFVSTAGAAPTRWIVVSDIDDTIRETGVVRDIPPAKLSGAHPKNLGHLLGDPFRHEHWTAVPGMAARYTQWRAHDRAEFVYLSCGPRFYRHWLTEFFWAGGFPHGLIFLNPRFPFSSGSKAAVLRKILGAQPDGAFIFIGDSGEQDPEIYGALAREFPHTRIRIFIRNVTPHDPPCRFCCALAETAWSLFTDAPELPAALDRPAKLPARHDQNSLAHRR